MNDSVANPPKQANDNTDTPLTDATPDEDEVTIEVDIDPSIGAAFQRGSHDEENAGEIADDIPIEPFIEPDPDEALAQLQTENAELKDRLVRAVAETDNVRKRGLREREEAGKFAISGFARDLINVLENLNRAMHSIPPEAREEDPLANTVIEGVEMTRHELLSVFERHGITRIDPIGEKFDHNYHQAVAQIPSGEHPAGTIVQVMQAGYVIGERLLRPAMVGVASPTGPGAEPKPQVDTEA